MKRYILCLFLLVSLQNAHAQQFSVTVKKGILVLNEIIVSENWDLKPVMELLGQPTRRYSKYYKAYIYDPLGIVVFEAKVKGRGTRQLNEIEFFLQESEVNEINPTGIFSGDIQIEKLKITASLTPKTITSKLKKYLENYDGKNHIYSFSYKEIYINCYFDEKETSLKRASIGHLVPQATI